MSRTNSMRPHKIILASLILFHGSIITASPIAKTWIYATIRIENEWGCAGTGFLVFRAIDEKSGRVFIVTNKHILHEDAEKRLAASKILLHLNIKNEEGLIVGYSEEIQLNLDDGTKRWREHPDRDVDVLAIDVTSLLVQYPQIEKKLADYSLFADKAKLEKFDITIGEEVMTIGYPLRLRQGATNFPLVRSGIIATRIGENFEDETKDLDGNIRKRILRGFLIDGGIVPGSSGSPVVLKPTTGRVVNGVIIMDSAPPLLLGIVASTIYVPMHQSFAGLGLAFDAETVRETIELFFK